YIQGRDGQIDGVVDAVIEYRDGTTVLDEWKCSKEITSDKTRAYTLQASVGALGIAAQNSYAIHRVDIVPVSAPSNTISLGFDNAFEEETREKLDHIFRDLRDRKYKPRKGSYCKSCQLKPQCPIWRKR
ncbi:MAG: PD-(D/E)XK nuclease family protein, partial [Gammaproteobacteria bacterium]